MCELQRPDGRPVIVLALDSFKGSMTAAQAVEAARRGVLEACPEAEVIGLPLADGGEGTVDALCRFARVHWVECDVCDPLFRTIKARYAVGDDGRTAIMEMASAAGLTLLSADERNPMNTTTYGVGQMMADAVARGCTRIIIGIGGSATNDGGMGMLAALGVRFYDKEGALMQPIGRNLLRMGDFDRSHIIDLSGIRIEVICDVQNPLYGEHGAARVYAEQKGASCVRGVHAASRMGMHTIDEVTMLDLGLRHFAGLFGHNPFLPGCGAAGGLGYGLMSIGANLRRGVDVVLDAAGIDAHLQRACLVITGEGRIDRQTLNGKLPCGVLQRAKACHVPVAAFAGAVEDESFLLQAGFNAVKSINPPGLPLSTAMSPSVAQANLTTCVSRWMGECFFEL